MASYCYGLMIGLPIIFSWIYWWIAYTTAIKRDPSIKGRVEIPLVLFLMSLSIWWSCLLLPLVVPTLDPTIPNSPFIFVWLGSLITTIIFGRRLNPIGNAFLVKPPANECEDSK
jgi:hypothetical protein